jgi:hypothetical protein
MVCSGAHGRAKRETTAATTRSSRRPATRAIGQSTAGGLGPRRRAQRPLMCGRHWPPARPSPHPTLRRTNTTPELAVAAAELGRSRCWLPNRCSLGGTPPSRTPPASGVRGDMPTDGALAGLHGGYSERSAGGARGAGASPNDVCTGRRWPATERRISTRGATAETAFQSFLPESHGCLLRIERTGWARPADRPIRMCTTAVGSYRQQSEGYARWCCR